ncbi:MAG: hypothetical protein JJU26_13165 [Oceanicaulis sp.]|uniref:hypothetical protein n=1 Tax=Glycocaulis sp. TaxID=1969725 RepID=UPI0025C53DDD|nr:hypothetical protein [Glycocaulis sp.]MCC5982656.1 hypothetical protein [Oceanicaulis sp.]MCH8522370.1 hypothetical protein [Glycocaulis sp.]
MAESSIDNRQEGRGVVAALRGTIAGINLGDLALCGAIIISTGLSLLALYESRQKQDEMVMVSYEQLASLFASEIVELVPSSELERMTDRYLVTAHMLTQEFSTRTGTVVIASEAVVGRGERMTDITGWVHRETMREIGAVRAGAE